MTTPLISPLSLPPKDPIWFAYYHFIRQLKIISKILSAKWTTNCRRIEIDITYECHLKCPNCNRSCTQAPSHERMSIPQIDKFIKESTDRGRKWETIRIVGGEPALHPDFLKIIERLKDYKTHYSPDTKIEIVTNGSGHVVREALKKVPKEFRIENTHKEDIGYSHLCFNDAPRDYVLHALFDYSAGCEIRSCCGMGLTPYGYYCCAIAGGIDRVLGLNIGRKTMPSENDSMSDQASLLCSYCGHFIWGRILPMALDSRDIVYKKISRSWQSAYREYNHAQKSKLMKY